MSGGVVRLVLALWVMLGASAVAAGEPATTEAELPGTLMLAAYRASAFSYQAQGSLLWLTGPDGTTRWEIRRGPPAGPDAEFVSDLTTQNGLGWTAVLGGPGDETLSPWDGAWRAPPEGLGQAAALVASALAEGPPAAEAEATRWRSAKAARGPQRYRIGSLAAAPLRRPGGAKFRCESVRRGLGRGGADEVLELSWPAADSAGVAWLRVRSTRRPGQLELASRGTRRVVYAMPETFVPLWPLSALMEFVP